MRSTFGDGTWIVGRDIAPGVYVAASPSDSAYWERLANFSGEDDGILANGFTSGSGQLVVEIRDGDVGFRTEDCGTWTLLAASASANPPPSALESNADDPVTPPSAVLHAEHDSDDGEEPWIYWPGGPPCTWYMDLDLRGLTGAELIERQLGLARGYFGFDLETARVEGIDVPIASLQRGERVYYVSYESPIVESRVASPGARVGAGVHLAAGVSIWTSRPVTTKPQASMLDAGPMAITNQRVVAVGSTRSQVWKLSELLGASWEPFHKPKVFGKGEHIGDTCYLHVSSRKKAVGIGVDAEFRTTFEFALRLALTDFAGEREALVAELAA